MSLLNNGVIEEPNWPARGPSSAVSIGRFG